MLSGGGDTLVVAAPAGTDAVGKVRAFDWDGTNWVQRGQDISAYANSENDFVSVLVAVNDNNILHRFFSDNDYSNIDDLLIEKFISNLKI